MTEQSKLILLAEDENHLAEGIRLNLEAEGYQVLWAQNGNEALSLWRRQKMDLIILDVMMPEENGFEVCKKIRAAGDKTPILFLTARSRTEERILGLELGADDYLAKPFHLKELLLRVASILRRQHWATSENANLLKFGNNWIDFSSYEASGLNNERFSLTQKECLLLKVLAEHKGEVVSRDEILDKVWGADQYPTPRTVDNFIVRLRRRFEKDPSNPRYLHTLRGVGYRFTPDPSG